MKILAFGEILYDIFGKEKKIGGAPFNFCAHFSRLGGKGFILSAVGRDENGVSAEKTANELVYSTKYLQKSSFPTGFCNVTYNGDEPNYDLSTYCAYDDIRLDGELISEIENEGFEVFYFGTLAARNEVSRRSLMRLLSLKCFKDVFFDMNLRQNYYDNGLIETALSESSIVKVNRVEMQYLKDEGFCTDERELCRKYGIKALLVTLDKDGMVLYEGDKVYRSGKAESKVVSTVGAGDASGACFLYNYLSGASGQSCVECANRMGDYIVGYEEAIPEYTDEIIANCKWQIEN